MGDPILPHPGEPRDDLLILQHRETTPGIPDRGWAPAYHFTVVLAGSGTAVGLLSLRVGMSESLQKYAGHIGYAIEKSHRGHRYAARSVRLVWPLARKLGLDPLWITCEPSNTASRRTCEIAGARLVETVEIPISHEMYAEGARFRCRFRLDVQPAL